MDSTLSIFILVIAFHISLYKTVELENYYMSNLYNAKLRPLGSKSSCAHDCSLIRASSSKLNFCCIFSNKIYLMAEYEKLFG